MRGTLPAVGAFVAAFGLANAAPALGQAPPPPPPPLPDDSAIYQYRESLPTGRGSVAPAPGSKRSTALPPATASKLEAQSGADTRLLEEIATSSDYGAPQRAAHDVLGRRPAAAKPTSLPDASVTRGLGAAATAVAGEGRLLGLVAAMLAVSLGFGVAARTIQRT